MDGPIAGIAQIADATIKPSDAGLRGVRRQDHGLPPDRGKAGGTTMIGCGAEVTDKPNRVAQGVTDVGFGNISSDKA